MNTEAAQRGGRDTRTEPGEQQFLTALLHFTRSARHSAVPGVATAARTWEGILSFRIRISMQERSREVRSKRNGLTVSPQINSRKGRQ